MQRYFSSIYWHFTGSPDVDWSKIREPKEIEGQYKSSVEAVNILKEILSSHKLIATSEEKILNNLKTESFSCVCDIPFKDLI